MRTYLILSLIVLLTAFGDFALKYASMKHGPLTNSWFIAGAVLYAATAAGWVLLMRTHDLGQIAVLYSSATILILTAVGVFLFGESVSLKQSLGLGAALLSVVLVQANA